jgi:hypothetical protein
MSAPDHNPRADLTPTQARSKLAVAHMGGDPDPDHKRLLRANLACANLDNKIRKELADVELYPVHVGHLVGLLLMSAGADGVALIEKLARDAVEARQTRDQDGAL